MNCDLIAELMNKGFSMPINLDLEERVSVKTILVEKERETSVKASKSSDKKESSIKKSSTKEEISKMKKTTPYYWRTEEELSDRMKAIVQSIAKKEIGMTKCVGYEKYDTSKMAQMLITFKKHELSKAKYSKMAKHIEFFIDTSMSMFEYNNSIAVSIRQLEQCGYTCYLRGCGNGFSSKDCYNDQYNVRATLESIGAGIVPEICRPTEQTASKLCNNAEFSVIISDFDGLSSIVRMARQCSKSKIPYFLSTESRYSWNNTTAHHWVEKENSTYEMKKVYEIAKKRNV